MAITLPARTHARAVESRIGLRGLRIDPELLTISKPTPNSRVKGLGLGLTRGDTGIRAYTHTKLIREWLRESPRGTPMHSLAMSHTIMCSGGFRVVTH